MIDGVGIKQTARDLFKRSYWPCVAAYLLFGMISSLLCDGCMYFQFGPWAFESMYMLPWAGIISFLVMPVLYVGVSYFFIRIARGDDVTISDMFSNSFSNFGRNLGGMLWYALWVAIWSCVFVIPGVYKAIRYSLTPYILAEYPDVSATDALKISNRATQGHAVDILIFWLSFIGWAILSGFTFGLLELFYVGPYRSAALAELYSQLMRMAVERGAVSPEELGLPE